MYEQDPVKFLETPVQQRLRYYFNNWGELRFFRHTDDIVWTRIKTTVASHRLCSRPMLILYGYG